MNHKLHILIVDEVHEELMICLKELGIDYTYSPEIAVDAIPGELLSYNGIIVRSKLHLTSEFLQMQPQLKFIARAGSGMDNIDLDEAERRNIMCVNAGEANADAVAEHALGLLLSLQHKIVKSNRELVQNKWDREGNRGQEIGTKTIGIIGFGKLGQQIAKIANAFGMNVIAWSENLKISVATDNKALAVTKEELLEQSDFISIHYVLSERSRNLIKYEDLSKMKSTAFIVNTSRGPLINENDLIKALEEKKIAGVGLDVYDNEPLPENHKLRFLPNAFLTPHLGYVIEQNYEIFYSQMAENLQSFLDGTPQRVIDGDPSKII